MLSREERKWISTSMHERATIHSDFRFPPSSIEATEERFKICYQHYFVSKYFHAYYSTWKCFYVHSRLSRHRHGERNTFYYVDCWFTCETIFFFSSFQKFPSASKFLHLMSLFNFCVLAFLIQITMSDSGFPPHRPQLLVMASNWKSFSLKSLIK